jgi:hypothetical protein
MMLQQMEIEEQLGDWRTKQHFSEIRLNIKTCKHLFYVHFSASQEGIKARLVELETEAATSAETTENLARSIAALESERVRLTSGTKSSLTNHQLRVYP